MGREKATLRKCGVKDRSPNSREVSRSLFERVKPSGQDPCDPAMKEIDAIGFALEPSMTDEQAFLQAICSTPDDLAPRLIYADWLDDQGQHERAEEIRGDIRTGSMVREEQGLCVRVAGFMEVIIIDPEEWSDRSEELTSANPLKTVVFLHRPKLRRVGGTPWDGPGKEVVMRVGKREATLVIERQSVYAEFFEPTIANSLRPYHAIWPMIGFHIVTSGLNGAIEISPPLDDNIFDCLFPYGRSGRQIGQSGERFDCY